MTVARMAEGSGWIDDHSQHGHVPRYQAIWPPREGRRTWLAKSTMHLTDDTPTVHAVRWEQPTLGGALLLFDPPTRQAFRACINRDLTETLAQ
jgi:hypothetical protein